MQGDWRNSPFLDSFSERHTGKTFGAKNVALKKIERAVSSPLSRNSSPSVGAKPTTKIGELQSYNTRLERNVKM
jgi:hypothetical protein